MLPLFLAPAICCTLAAQQDMGATYRPREDLDRGRFLKALADADAVLAAKGVDDKLNALAWGAKAQALCALTRFREAESAAQQALKLQPALPEALVALSMTKAGIAIQQRNLGSLKMASQAMNGLREAVAGDPDYPLAWMTLGLGYQQLPGVLGGSSKKALECAEQLKRIQPARGDLLLGRILSMEGKWLEAEPAFKRALAAAPNDPEIVVGYLNELGEKAARRALGEAAQKQKLTAEAKRLLPLVRRSARGIEAVSLAYIDAGLSEEAWEAALEGLPRADAPSILKLQLGKVAARTGINLEDGLAFLDQAAKEPLEGGTGGYAAVHWRRGQILRKLDRPSEARDAASKALSYDPQHRGAKNLLNELK